MTSQAALPCVKGPVACSQPHPTVTPKPSSDSLPGRADLAASQPLLPELSSLSPGTAALDGECQDGEEYPRWTYRSAPEPYPELTEYMAFSSSRALACLMASASSLSFRSILQRKRAAP